MNDNGFILQVFGGTLAYTSNRKNLRELIFSLLEDISEQVKEYTVSLYEGLSMISDTLLYTRIYNLSSIGGISILEDTGQKITDLLEITVTSLDNRLKIRVKLRPRRKNVKKK